MYATSMPRTASRRQAPTEAMTHRTPAQNDRPVTHIDIVFLSFTLLMLAANPIARSNALLDLSLYEGMFTNIDVCVHVVLCVIYHLALSRPSGSTFMLYTSFEKEVSRVRTQYNSTRRPWLLPNAYLICTCHDNLCIMSKSMARIGRNDLIKVRCWAWTL